MAAPRKPRAGKSVPPIVDESAGSSAPLNSAEGASGTAREAPSAGSGTEGAPASASSVGTQSAPPHAIAETHGLVADAAAAPGADIAIIDPVLVSVNVPTGVIAPETQDTLLAMADAAATALRSNREAVPGVRIVAKRDGFRRAGIAHSTAPATYPLHTLADEQLEALLAEPMLVVELVEDVGAP